MKNALIGHTGFVGGTLLKQLNFDALYRSTDIHKIEGEEFDMVVCAGAPAQKWMANKMPDHDRENIETLINALHKVKCKTFILISTVDVFKVPVGVDENSPVIEDGLHPYGLHRYLLEKFVTRHFRNHLIVRLPGLVGPGLRKNVIFDLHNNNNLAAVDTRGVFQFYPMVNLWSDLQAAMAAGLKLVHLSSEPINISMLADQGFGRKFNQALSGNPVRYDMQTLNGKVFSVSGRYQYSQKETIQAVRAYAQSEPYSKDIPSGALT